MEDLVAGSAQAFDQSNNQLCAVVPKLWGREEWIVNNEKYCGKKLIFNQGFSCSLHFHKIKEESFYILSGKVFLELVDSNKRFNRVMNPRDIHHIKIGVWHRLTALTDAEVMEFSTHHQDDDSYRVENARQVDLLQEPYCHAHF